MAIEKCINKTGIAYKVRVYNKGKPVKYGKFLRKADAEKWEAEQLVKLEQEKNFPHSVIKSCTVEELYNLWIVNHSEVRNAPSTVRRKKQIYRDFIKPAVGNMKTTDVTSIHIDKLINKLPANKKSGKKLSKKSINNILEVIKTIFSYGVKKKLTYYNPMSDVEMITVDELSFKFWSKKDATKFLSHARTKYADKKQYVPIIYLIALYTGMRLGEIIGLRWTAIDFERNLITVNSSYDNTSHAVKDTTKGKRCRYVGINKELLTALKEYRLKTPKTEFVVENQNGKNVDPDSFRSRNFVTDIAEAKVQKIKFHDLRHTFASHYVTNKGSLYELQAILGHADMQTTSRYAHLAPTHIAQTASIVDFSETEEAEKTG